MIFEKKMKVSKGRIFKTRFSELDLNKGFLAFWKKKLFSSLNEEKRGLIASVYFPEWAPSTKIGKIT